MCSWYFINSITLHSHVLKSSFINHILSVTLHSNLRFKNNLLIWSGAQGSDCYSCEAGQDHIKAASVLAGGLDLFLSEADYHHPQIYPHKHPRSTERTPWIGGNKADAPKSFHTLVSKNKQTMFWDPTVYVWWESLGLLCLEFLDQRLCLSCRFKTGLCFKVDCPVVGWSALRLNWFCHPTKGGDFGLLLKVKKLNFAQYHIENIMTSNAGLIK